MDGWMYVMNLSSMLNPTGTGQARAKRATDDGTDASGLANIRNAKTQLVAAKRLLSQHLLGAHLQKPYLAAGQTSEVPPNLSRH